MRTLDETVELRGRSVAFALLARLLGPDTAVLRSPEHLQALRTVVAEIGDQRASARLAALEEAALPAPDDLAGRWVRWFDLGRVAPYEGSNVTVSAGGVTPRLADVAGFYRAFGMAVSGERPDHVVAQLEFLSFALLSEAEALEQDDLERGEVAGHAIRSFLRDHVGTWIDAWAARVAAIDELAPWAPIAWTAVELVRHEAAVRNVIPARPAPLLPADAGIATDDEPILECGDESEE